MRLHRGPDAELLERRLAIFTGRHRGDRAHGELAIRAERFGQRKARLDLERRGRILRRDENQRVAEQRHARCSVDQVLLGEIVHPVEIGREEDVRRRAGFDLLGERRGRGIADRDVLAGLGLVGGHGGVERVLEASRGEDRDVGGMGKRRGERRGDEDGAGKGDEAAAKAVGRHGRLRGSYRHFCTETSMRSTEAARRDARAGSIASLDACFSSVNWTAAAAPPKLALSRSE